MSDQPFENNETPETAGVLAKYRNLKPFQKGQSGNPGGKSKRVGQIQRALLKLAPDAIKAIERGVKEGDPVFVAMWLKYCLPPPREEEAVDGEARRLPRLDVETAQRLAEMDS